MGSLLAFSGLALLLLLLGGSSWGPGIHLDLALRALKRRTGASEGLLLCREHREDFLYGTIAADIVTFKSYGGARGACHRWTVIQRLRKLVREPAEEAFVLGYGAHLAADTVSHNNFVPYHLCRYPRYGALGHLYWELCADQDADPRVWDLIQDLQRRSGLRTHDDLIGRAVPKRVFSMGVNKRIFNHLVLAAGKERWRRGMALARRRTRDPLPRSRLDRFRRLALRRVRQFLEEGLTPELVLLDPSGKRALAEAAGARRRFRRTRGRGEPARPAEGPREESIESFSRRYLP